MPTVSISPIKVSDLSFLILDCPSDTTLPAYIPVLEEHNVTDLVRICEGNPYSPQPLNAMGITVHDDMKFQDGTAPGKDVVARWLDLNDRVFFDTPKSGRCIAVHCVSGIGRAPVLVAISLVENGMDALDAIAYIRKVRRGALNRVQIAFLDSLHSNVEFFYRIK
ncbi:Protein tyrosine phosphatase type IVA 1 [Podila clonocystis]|nr:Protein tyrosine phosphatase type IVA 1 [Podila clonocystis]